MLAMWEYPKSARHQAAIDAQRSDRDRESAESVATQKKLLRQSETELALKEIEASKVAVLAKTLRLRAARLAPEAIALPAKAYNSRKNKRLEPGQRPERAPYAPEPDRYCPRLTPSRPHHSEH